MRIFTLDVVVRLPFRRKLVHGPWCDNFVVCSFRNGDCNGNMQVGRKKLRQKTIADPLQFALLQGPRAAVAAVAVVLLRRRRRQNHRSNFPVHTSNYNGSSLVWGLFVAVTSHCLVLYGSAFLNTNSRNMWMFWPSWRRTYRRFCGSNGTWYVLSNSNRSSDKVNKCIGMRWLYVVYLWEVHVQVHCPTGNYLHNDGRKPYWYYNERCFLFWRRQKKL